VKVLSRRKGTSPITKKGSKKEKRGPPISRPRKKKGRQVHYRGRTRRKERPGGNPRKKAPTYEGKEEREREKKKTAPLCSILGKGAAPTPH